MHGRSSCIRAFRSRSASPEELLDVARGKGTGDQVALPGLAAFALESRELLGALDALRDGFDVEKLAELYQRADYRSSLLGVAHGGDERPVDFYRVDWKLLEVGQRRVASTEIVDGEPHAQRLQRFQLVQGVLGVAHETRLGHLDSR